MKETTQKNHTQTHDYKAIEFHMTIDLKKIKT